MIDKNNQEHLKIDIQGSDPKTGLACGTPHEPQDNHWTLYLLKGSYVI